MSWGGYIPGGMLRKLIEEGKLDEFIDAMTKKDYSKDIENAEFEEDTEGETQNVQR